MQQLTATAPPGRRGLVATLAACAAWLALLYAFRFGFMEIEAEADPCLNDPLGALCRARAVIGMSIHLQLFGTAALVLALAAHLRLGRFRRALALAGLFAALLALVLYNVRYGAPAAVVALLAPSPIHKRTCIGRIAHDLVDRRVCWWLPHDLSAHCSMQLATR